MYLHLAHPSAHARTPQVMNAEFARRGVDAVAVSADVAPGDLGGFVRGLRGWRNLAGLSVTMPHKEALASHVDELAGPATLIGAVNVVRREPDGRLVAANTDGSGFVIGLREAGHDLSGRRVLLAGAGGAGRAVAFAVAEAGVTHLTIANRTTTRAERLARERLAETGVMCATGVNPGRSRDLQVRLRDPESARDWQLRQGLLWFHDIRHPLNRSRQISGFHTPIALPSK